MIKRIALTSLFLLSSCGLPLNQPPPYMPVSEGWKWPVVEPEGDIEELANWWEIFDDPVLDALIARALEYNQTLEQAYHRMREARALACVSCSYLWPTLTLDPLFSNSDQVVQNPAGVGPSQLRFQMTQYELPLSVSYDFDLWQKYTHECLAGKARANAELEHLEGTKLLLTTDVAQTYYKLRELDTELRLLKDTIAIRLDSLRLNQSRYDNGIVNRLDVSRAELLLAETEGDFEDIVRHRALHENALAVLCGSLPEDFIMCLSPLEEEAPVVIADLPSDVMCRRPDIAEAERHMEALYSEMGVAYASLFPSLRLTGQIGYSSPELNNLFKWASNMWAIALYGSQTVFDAGRNCANLEAAKARYCQGIASYRQTILTAFQEVENALANSVQNERLLKTLVRQVEAAQDIATLTDQRYKDGIITSLDVFDAQRVLLDTQRQEVRVRGQRFLDAVLLIKALGGGW